MDERSLSQIHLFVPGRLCLFGEHSDWAGMYRTFNADIVKGTDPKMTRFLMNLDEAVELIAFAFEHAEPGDLFIQKADASTIPVDISSSGCSLKYCLLGRLFDSIIAFSLSHNSSCIPYRFLAGSNWNYVSRRYS